jgi:hypothetical protein
MKKTAIALTVLAAICVLPLAAFADAGYQALPFSQDWTNTGLITTSNDWSGVPGIEGFGGMVDVAPYSGSGQDPQGLLDDASFVTSPPAVWVIANVTTFPSAQGSGGVYEFEGTNNPDPSVGMQGSGTADAPFLKIYLNATGKQNVRVRYDLRDIDCQTFTTTAGQKFALHYRVGTSGLWTNLSGGYVADAAGASGQCSKVTPVDVTLPPAANNAAQLQLRIMTTNAGGTDEMTGVDNISITGEDIPPTTGACCLRAAPGACVMVTPAECDLQNGVFMGLGVLCAQVDCAAVPATRTTWGKVKTIYR